MFDASALKTAPAALFTAPPGLHCLLSLVHSWFNYSSALRAGHTWGSAPRRSSCLSAVVISLALIQRCSAVQQHSAERHGGLGGAGPRAEALKAGAQVCCCCRGRLVRLSPLSRSGCERARGLEGGVGPEWGAGGVVCRQGQQAHRREQRAAVTGSRHARQLVIRKRAQRELLSIQQGNPSS